MNTKHPGLHQRHNNLTYHALTPVGGQHCHVYFQGTFAAQPVEWDTQIVTLEEQYRRQRQRAGMGEGAALELRQFIEVGEMTAQRRQLIVALNVTQIDAPTIFKTIVMIHNYKLLRYGVHEYGPRYHFPDRPIMDSKGAP